eukprot:GHVR01147053.1.p2 GENE.GHVR01147053.1~~GHVR01147053.1.p2  ORF type:complete len:120 (-),score=45.95 GHVR01147053.1:282-620(-)
MLFLLLLSHTLVPSTHTPTPFFPFSTHTPTPFFPFSTHTPPSPHTPTFPPTFPLRFPNCVPKCVPKVGVTEEEDDGVELHPLLLMETVASQCMALGKYLLFLIFLLFLLFLV